MALFSRLLSAYWECSQSGLSWDILCGSSISVNIPEVIMDIGPSWPSLKGVFFEQSILGVKESIAFYPLWNQNNNLFYKT